MIRNLLLIPFIFAMSLRCSHTATTSSMTPPYQSKVYHDLSSKDPESVEKYFSKYKTPETQAATRFWVNYKLAQVWQKHDKNKSCEYFKVLSTEKEFPLSDLAYLKTIDTCDGKSITSDRLFAMKKDKDKAWLMPEIQRLQYDYAKAQNMYPQNAEAAISLSKDSLIRPEKITYTEEALKWAKEHNDNDRIKQYEQRIQKLSPSRGKAKKKSDPFDLAYDYRRDRKFAEAIKIYKQIARKSSSSIYEKLKAWSGVATSHKLMRDKENYIKALYSHASVADRYYRKNKKSATAAKLHHNSQVQLARALWTEGQVSKARKILVLLAKWLKGKYPTDQVNWLIARMAEEKSDFEKAIYYAKESMDESRSEDSTYYEKSAWIYAWNLKKINQPMKAAESFKELYQKTDNEYDAAKYKFWYAHSLAEAEQEVDAYQVYKELADEDPLGYYGLLSYRQRGEKLPDLLHTQEIFANDQALDLKRDLLSQIEWLIALDENKLAQDYLKSLKIQPKSDEQRQNLYNLYGKAGYYAGIFRDLASLEPERKRALVEKNPEYLFPRPYLAKVNEISQKYGVEASLVYSIIRQESSFIPHARSFADAFGLMQLIPKQAKRLAKIHDVDYEEAEDLYKPVTNLSLGIPFLRELWDRKQGQFIMTVASYNASERAVLGWINTRYKGDPITFIEDIPYSETKAYIKLVLRNFIWYKRLAAKSKETPYPEWALQGLGDFKTKPRKISSEN